MNAAEQAIKELTSRPLVFGDQRQVHLVKIVEEFEGRPAVEECDECEGTGQVPCGRCGGDGTCRHCEAECGTCDGDGDVACKHCRGAGELAPEDAGHWLNVDQVGLFD